MKTTAIILAALAGLACAQTNPLEYADGLTVKFNPNGTRAGINVGAHTGAPSTTANGDVYYNSTDEKLYARINGSWQEWANVSALNANNLTSGTVPDARFPATLPALSAANLTALNGSAIASGTVAEARIHSDITRDSEAAAAYTSKGGDTMTGLLQFSGTGHAGIKLNSLTTTQRDALTPAAGLVIYNTTDHRLEYYDATDAQWKAGTGGGGGGDVTASANYGTDNVLLRSDGTGKGTQSSAWSLTDAGNMTATVSSGSALVLDGSADDHTTLRGTASGEDGRAVFGTASGLNGIGVKGDATNAGGGVAVLARQGHASATALQLENIGGFFASFNFTGTANRSWQVGDDSASPNIVASRGWVTSNYAALSGGNTIAGTQNFSGTVNLNGTTNAGTLNITTLNVTNFIPATIEVGNASDTTLARIAAGRVSIEGNEIATLTGTQTLTNKKLGSLTSNGLVTTSGGDGTLSVTVPGTGVLTALANNTNATGGLLTRVVTPTKQQTGAYTVGTTDANEPYGGVIYASNTGTISLPAVAVGMSVTVIADAAVVVTVDPNGSEQIRLEGSTLSAGFAVKSAGAIGEVAVFTYYGAGVWFCSSATFITNGS